MNMPQQRLFFLDWVRILAFFLLILYHVGMYYVSWDWHVKSPAASDAIEPLMILSSPWRLGLLFMVAGVASSFLIGKAGKLAFVRERSVRLLIPLIFGMLVIVPPQPFFEVIEKVGYQGSYLDFMRLYLNAYQGFCKDGECVDLPTWNHLWFVAYLWLYSLLFAGLLALLGRHFDTVSKAVAARLSGWKIIVLPLLVLGLARLLLVSQFPSTHDVVDDWYNHAHYMTLFLLGAMLGRQSAVWQRFDAMRRPALVIALLSWAALIYYFSLPEEVTMDPALYHWRLIMRMVYALCAWSAIVAVCGFAHHYLNFDSARRRYLSEAVFPVYIVHQTLIVSMAHLMKPAAIRAPLEGLLLVVLTIGLSFAIFEGVRRVPLLRPLFGLRWSARTASAAPVDEKPATANCRRAAFRRAPV